MAKNGTDKIRISGLKLETVIGVPDEERAAGPQQVSVNVEITPDTTFAKLDDEIEGTVDYFEVTRALQQVAAVGERKLIETLADDLARAVLNFPNARAVRIEVRKFILPETDNVSVITEKSR